MAGTPKVFSHPKTSVVSKKLESKKRKEMKKKAEEQIKKNMKNLKKNGNMMKRSEKNWAFRSSRNCADIPNTINKTRTMAL